MGMDVYGQASTDERGEYFRASVWGWHPLAELLAAAAPELIGKIECLHTNDGDGLGAEDAVALADILDAWLADGRAARYVHERDTYLSALPRLICRQCAGTGVRTDEVGVRMGMDKRGWCNGCDGQGHVADHETYYTLDVERVAEFAEFVRYSGGFEIH